MKTTTYTPQPIDTTGIELPQELMELAEQMAKNVHEVWSAGRIADGWTYGEVRNDTLKQHPCLIPYEDLPESEKAYDRNTSTATYNNWGHTVNEDKSLVSRIGHYNSDIKTFYIYVQVVLQDSNMRLETDTLTYCTESHLAEFSSPTYIYSDSSILYSENGSYNTETRYAYSTKSSRVQNMEKILSCDTLHYY